MINDDLMKIHDGYTDDYRYFMVSPASPHFSIYFGVDQFH